MSELSPTVGRRYHCVTLTPASQTVMVEVEAVVSEALDGWIITGYRQWYRRRPRASSESKRYWLPRAEVEQLAAIIEQAAT